jgi:predicted phage terminase large subunit-like protein
VSGLNAVKAQTAHRVLHNHARSDFHVFQALLHPTVSAETYVDAKHLRAIAWKLQQVANGKIRRLMIAVPPRHFKSYQTSVAFPAFMLGQNPALKIICASYGWDLADTFASQARDMLRSPRYGAIFPDTRLRSMKPALQDLRTTGGGYRYTTSTGGPLTGLGADILILDDPLKAAEASSKIAREGAYEWLKSTAMTRFDHPAESVVIVVMQRLHQDDVIGRLKAEGGWDLLELPAEATSALTFATGPSTGVILKPGDILFPQRFNEAVLAERRQELGEAAYSAQYLQRPTPPGGHLFKMKKFKRFELAGNNKIKDYEAVILSLDPGVSSAPTADFSAYTIWGIRGTEIYLLGAARGRWDFTTQLKHLQKHRPLLTALLVERSHMGIALLERLRSEAGDDNKLIGFNPKLEKLVRAEFAANMIEKGEVFLPHQAPWLEPFEHELAGFPHVDNDDQVDSVSQFFLKLKYGFPHWVDLSAFPREGIGNAYVLGN